MASVNINDELRAFAEKQAAKQGFSSLEEYVEALLLNAKRFTGLAGTEVVISGIGKREPRSRKTVLADIAELDRLRVGNRLNGLSVRDLIDEGKRP